jgi:CheY-like chemotaxis protein
MSHELRTPLTAILGFSQLLELDQDTAKSGQIAYCLDHIVKNGKLLLALINDLLDLARIDAGRLSTSPERVILADLVAGVAASLQPLADDIGLTLSIHGDAGLPDVRADQIRLTQVLLNLGTNAVKYNRPNGRVDVICQRLNPDWVRLTVADTGTGIPEARQGEVFQPFNRLGREAGSIEGTGIGLALSRRLMQSMGGRIGFSSRPGQGSRFWIDVPAYAAATAAQAPCGEAGAETETGTGAGTGAAPARTTDQGGSRTVLCVDDNAAARALVSKIVFGIPGTRVLTADTAEAGIALARRQPPDLILMDINLPGMDGVAALIELRRHAGTRDIPVFALSAATTAADIDRGLAAGFDRYLTKPYDARDLLTAVTSIRPASHLDGGTGPLNRRIMPGSSVRSEGVAA